MREHRQASESDEQVFWPKQAAHRFYPVNLVFRKHDTPRFVAADWLAADAEQRAQMDKRDATNYRRSYPSVPPKSFVELPGLLAGDSELSTCEAMTRAAGIEEIADLNEKEWTEMVKTCRGRFGLEYWWVLVEAGEPPVDISKCNWELSADGMGQQEFMRSEPIRVVAAPLPDWIATQSPANCWGWATGSRLITLRRRRLAGGGALCRTPSRHLLIETTDSFPIVRMRREKTISAIAGNAMGANYVVKADGCLGAGVAARLPLQENRLSAPKRDQVFKQLEWCEVFHCNFSRQRVGRSFVGQGGDYFSSFAKLCRYGLATREHYKTAVPYVFECETAP